MAAVNLFMKQALLATLLLSASAAVAPASGQPKEPVDAGAIIMPPPTDPKAVKPAPQDIDPKAVKPPSRAAPDSAAPAEPKRTRPQKIPAKKRSKDADCKGAAELCKQSSPQ